MFFNPKSKPTQNGMKQAVSNNQIKVLLLENINATALDIFQREGYQVEHYNKALPEEELIRKIKDEQDEALGKILEAAENLLTIGCFCIGTNQVDLEFAAKKSIPVFNSPSPTLGPSVSEFRFTRSG
ncbi:D-3-phosphoglycerate dehydrogenase 2 [Massospora cicadina]|nr:D-3-phosphoglycerate dehydrogenase 2 [Massospora cicadina]